MNLADLFAEKTAAFGLPEGYLQRTAQIESGMRPGARNPQSSAGGLFQFIDSTAQRYGLQNRFDPAQATMAAARLARDNAGILSRALGRSPTAAELYLAHQQGAGGAARMLSNPTAPAASIVGRPAIALNGGGANMTAGEFAAQWLRKFNGGTTMKPGQVLPMMAQAGAPQPVTPGFQMAPPIAQPGAISVLAQLYQAQQADEQARDERAAEEQAVQARRRALFSGAGPFG